VIAVPLPEPAALRSEDNVLDRIETHRAESSGSLGRVADRVLADPRETHGISIVELARRSGVSENSDTCVCPRICYSGSREFATQRSATPGRVPGAASFAPPDSAPTSTTNDAMPVGRPTGPALRSG
jgi:DNA-binding MurR/RpiR family transcriptional regulator